MNIIDQKISTAQYLSKEAGKFAGKVHFIPDATLVDAMRCMEETDIPTAKVEDYKYCNIDAYIRKHFKSFGEQCYLQADFSPYLLPNADKAICLFFSNSEMSIQFPDNYTLPSHLTISTLAEANETFIHSYLGKRINAAKEVLYAFNTAFMSNGYCIHASGNNHPEIQCYYANASEENGMEQLHHLLVLDPKAELSIREIFCDISGNGNQFQNRVWEIFVEEEAHLKMLSLQTESEKQFSIHQHYVYQARKSVYQHDTFTWGAQMTRNNHQVYIDGEHCETRLNGLYIAKNNNLVDNHTLIDHRVPNCESFELYKGIVADKGTGIFNGKIFVQRDAQKTNAYQSSKNILLSDDATVNTKPQLEIYADDVKCSHGTSTGKIDEEALFYLKARGIGDMAAKRLLLQAFANDVVGQSCAGELSEYISQQMEKQLNN